MADIFVVNVTFLDDRFHGRCDGGAPEWPPSPLRLFQAVVAANRNDLNSATPTGKALRWLERQPPPEIIAPDYWVGQARPTYVPNNQTENAATKWISGKEPYTQQGNLAIQRSLKVFRPVHLMDASPVQYRWRKTPPPEVRQPLIDAIGRVCVLGLGIDLVVGEGKVSSATGHGPNNSKSGRRFVVDSRQRGGAPGSRVPVAGTLDALIDRHDDFLERLDGGVFTPGGTLTQFRTVYYGPADQQPSRPCHAFEMRRPDGDRYAYPVTKLIHIAGRVRHAALSVTEHSSPDGVANDWRSTFVAGHRGNHDRPHRQISFLPIPSIGHRHTNPSIRRVVISSDVETADGLRFVGHRLAGARLTPENRAADVRTDAILVPVKNDLVLQRYLTPSQRWASVTPVILPGHNDRRRSKTRKLIVKALRESGITTPCEFEFSEVSRWPNVPTAAKPRGRHSQPACYRPDHLRHLPAIHLEIEFKNDSLVPGPLCLGAGRHLGLGLMASIDSPAQ